MRKSLLGAALLCLMSWSAIAAEGPIKNGHPDTYTVVKGDTLWDISNTFLNTPWLWPEIWHANPQIDNPHLIYPGDVISLVYIDGRPRLTLSSRGEASRTIKLSPKVRSTPIDSVIPAIPLDKINSLLKRSRVVSSLEELERAPYIVAAAQDKVISGVDDQIYARGSFEANAPAYGVYRQGDVIVDPSTREVLGVMAVDLGAVDVKQIEGDIATLRVTRSDREIRSGDRLLESEERRIDSTFFPSAPGQRVEGEILAVSGGISQIGLYDNVLVNLGERDGIQPGNVLAINRNLTVVDEKRKQQLTLPEHRVGLLMVYRSFEKVSFGIILETNEPLMVGDRLENP
ncbi:LysM peptidoglycan-binding domain-containing protein [Aestuariirhabdus litorea]|uniref:LysM peptidoglycan-binding domain-containing protein n=1 Tax=Aestuariirhabdus litorea TaxID=2528527 RepID=A0A3P3VIN5_9GAMM|nr:LysM peptidoglycan-binding domain-containing protein [Aestuariirhabdus litorea]RRJ82580.1 LysM peptidoglycan-binding domain-containing protein [Aestuariirhabdus litorea]RWW92738.1 LysM peptidoglycan-binding domain-containing protein [Endozoicomonadaceae bacterium GTF-13]